MLTLRSVKTITVVADLARAANPTVAVAGRWLTGMRGLAGLLDPQGEAGDGVEGEERVGGGDKRCINISTRILQDIYGVVNLK